MKTYAATLLLALFVTVPADLLTRMADARTAAERAAAAAWPNWDPARTPLAAVQREQFMVAVGAKQMPVPFAPYQDGVFVAPPTAYPASAVGLAVVAADDFMARTPEEADALAIHELFRIHEHQIAPKKVGDIEVMLFGKYPDFSARNQTLLEFEGQALHDALVSSDDAGTRQHVGEFLAYRNERRKEMAKDLIRHESGEESSEGLASYVEYRLLESAFPNRADLLQKRVEPLAKLNSAAHPWERFYELGMAEALLLDRLRPGWKQEYESTPQYLDDILAKVTTPAERMKEWGNFLTDQQKELARREDEGTRRLGLMLAKGRKVVIEIGAAKSKLHVRGLNPNLVVQLTPNHTAFSFLQLDLDDMHLDFTGVPVVYEKLQDAFWCMLPDDVVENALKNIDTKWTIEGRGFKLEFENVEAVKRGKEIRIHPAVEMQKGKPFKPDFVKPPKESATDKIG